jgi:aspartate ammonia-lyase
MKMRLEQDSLGKHEAPFYVYDGIQTQHTIDSFRIKEHLVYPQLIRRVGIEKKAAATMNRESN